MAMTFMTICLFLKIEGVTAIDHQVVFTTRQNLLLPQVNSVFLLAMRPGSKRGGNKKN